MPTVIENKSPFHAGEQELQERTGKRKAMEKFGQQAIRTYMPDQHRAFYENIPFIVIGSVDDSGWPWATILSGKSGFMNSLDNKTLEINAKAPQGDPLNEAMKKGRPIGLLGIETTTRRRNRLNARIQSTSDSGIILKVDQSFGNCPQYIQKRDVDLVCDSNNEQDIDNSIIFKSFDESLIKLISNSDTFFVSSFIEAKDRPEIEGVDVSHRGGNPGFVKVENSTLTIPDFSGNYHFNTMGNFLLNPKAGIVFIDYETGDLILLTGTVELIWDNLDEHIKAFEGAHRGWKFTLNHGKILKGAFPFKTKFLEYSPNTLLTGNWKDAQEIVEIQANRDSWRDFKLTKVVDESSVIKSFYFESTTNKVLFPFEAGQYLTIKITPNINQQATIRTYTVSSAPGSKYYRISVKREEHGLVSKFLHDELKIGDVIEAKAPRGDFYIDPKQKRPAVLLAGGVGITPMISMAEHFAKERTRSRNNRSLTIFHSTQTTKQQAFEKDFKLLKMQSGGSINYLSFIDRPAEGEKPGVDYNGTGYITADILRQVLPLDDYDFYLCGPPSFMQSIYDALRNLGVRDIRIYAESFGPASLKRKADLGSKPIEIVEEADQAILKFTKSGFEQNWSAGDKTILETAEDHGLIPSYGCRIGACGSCAVKLKTGTVAYRTKTTADHAADEVLICCAVPAKNTKTLEIEL
jgi:ferredoxin-NADP reductase/predicted pyridoxine 5'-phosphate oxidase superfamily flavin-nucleotide-binding protein